MKYLQDSFSVSYGGRMYQDNYDRIFRKQDTEDLKTSKQMSPEELAEIYKDVATDGFKFKQYLMNAIYCRNADNPQSGFSIKHEAGIITLTFPDGSVVAFTEPAVFSDETKNTRLDVDY